MNMIVIFGWKLMIMVCVSMYSKVLIVHQDGDIKENLPGKSTISRNELRG
jgi:hypothetical protein